MSKSPANSRSVPSLPSLPRHARSVQLLLPLIAPERRSSGRWPFEAVVRAFGGRLLGQAVDLGMSGMKVLRRGSTELQRRGPLMLSFCLPDGERLHVPAEVIFDRPEEGASRTRVTGLRFCALPAAAEQRLRSFMD